MSIFDRLSFLPNKQTPLALSGRIVVVHWDRDQLFYFISNGTSRTLKEGEFGVVPLIAASGVQGGTAGGGFRGNWNWWGSRGEQAAGPFDGTCEASPGAAAERQSVGGFVSASGVGFADVEFAAGIERRVTDFGCRRGRAAAGRDPGSPGGRLLCDSGFG